MGSTVEHSEGTKRDRRHPAWISRLRARIRSDRGSTLVEAAVATPVFLLLVMALIEGGLYMNDNLAVANTVRAGSRTASAAGAADSADLYTVLNISRESSAINRQNINFVVIYKATGYGAGPTDGTGPGTGCKSGIPVAGVCNVYRPIDFIRAEVQVKEEGDQRKAEKDAEDAGVPVTRVIDQNKLWFRCQTTGPHADASPDRFWCPTTRKDARTSINGNGPPDYVGVYMSIEHPWITKIFGNQKSLDDQSVIRIEPQKLS